MSRLRCLLHPQILTRSLIFVGRTTGRLAASKHQATLITFIREKGSRGANPKAVNLRIEKTSQENTGVQKKLHDLGRAFRGPFRNAFRASSSARIQDWMVSTGRSRTGMAVAGCRNTPPSLSSTTRRGFSRRSSPSRRRIAGGKVIPPRLFKVSVVMVKFCNTALRQSSTDRDRLLVDRPQEVDPPNPWLGRHLIVF